MDTDKLTDQQRVVFQWLILGKSNKEIADELGGLSEKTIKAHVTHIFKALKCTSRSQVIARHYLEQARAHS